MIPVSLKDEMNPKLNIDGFIDSSDEEDSKNSKKRKQPKRKAYISDSSEDESSNREKKKTKKASVIPVKKPNTSLQPEHDNDSDISLPDVSSEASSSLNMGEPSKASSSAYQGVTTDKRDETVSTSSNIIIPPKDPAVRAGRRRPTLLVCPTSLISHWVEQLDLHLHPSVDIKVKVHHGASKSLTAADLESHDVVITTYGTMAAESNNREMSPLLKAKWLRVVLDEGHYIKNHLSKSAKAAMNLDTLRKWIVTGTPIQNNLMELWSLVNWLEFGLYAGKSQMRVFKRHIERPCKKGIPRGFERLQMLMDTICLRRTKEDRRPDGSYLVSLPNKNVVIRKVEMSEDEQLCYGIYSKGAQDVVKGYQKEGRLLRNYAHIFALMTRMRQLCCHRETIKEVDWVEALKDKEGLKSQLAGFLNQGDTKENENADVTDTEKRLMNQLRDLIRSGVSEDCSICLDDLNLPVITPCAHVFCRACIERVIETIKPPACPLCRGLIKNKTELLEAGNDDEDDEIDPTLADLKDIEVQVSSSKVNAVIKEMIRIKRDMPDDKMIVVSQFTSFLSILQPLIKKEGFSVARLDGSMSHINRAEVVKNFQSGDNASPEVLLLSLKAGGVGLNLTAANHLLLLDPAWNPASEWQCFDRTHRLGQKKDVTIYKFITTDTIEEKMLEIQSKKKDLISGAFTMPADDRRQQRVNDIRNIFGI